MQKIATASPPASANLEERRWLPVLQELGALRFGLGSTISLAFQSQEALQ